MNKKSVESHLRKKLEDWLNCIDDKELRKEVRENVILTGGSIPSLLLNEKVNDYDVYIQDEHVLERLVKWYVKDVKGVEVLTMNDRFPVITGDIKRARDIAILNLKKGQVKLYFDENEAGKKIEYKESDKKDKYRILYLSPNAISLSDKIQVVTRFSGNPEKIHENFDFVHVTSYFTFKDGLVVNERALLSILTKQLKYEGSLYPITSIFRVRKFVKRGWGISAGEILKACVQISQLDLLDIVVLEEQLIGVDVAYFGLIIEELKKVIINNDTQLTPSLLCEIIDRVFDKEGESEEEEEGEV